MVSVPWDHLLCFIPESPVLGVLALKGFCSAGASKACVVQGIPLLSAGKLLGEIHHMGEIQHCVCIFPLQEHDILWCSGLGSAVVLEEESIFSPSRGTWKKGERVTYLGEIRQKNMRIALVFS